MAGEVFIQGKRIDKAGTAIEEDTCEVEIFLHRQNMWGAAAINSKRPCKSSILIQQTKYFWISAPPRAVLPIACCNKAQKVYAIDVGYGQLDYVLRIDERVVSVEKTNFRYLKYDTIGEKADGFVMDVSFISVLKLTENLKQFLKQGAEAFF